MASRLLVSTSCSVAVGQVSFGGRSFPHGPRLLVVDLGGQNLTMHLLAVASVDALAAAVGDARGQFHAALAGQGSLLLDGQLAPV
jgi:hypothetical protein